MQLGSGESVFSAKGKCLFQNGDQQMETNTLCSFEYTSIRKSTPLLS